MARLIFPIEGRAVLTIISRGLNPNVILSKSVNLDGKSVSSPRWYSISWIVWITESMYFFIGTVQSEMRSELMTNIVWSISACARPVWWEHAELSYRKLFIIWRSLYCLALPCLALSCLVVPCRALSCLAFTYFLNSPDPSLKYGIQFLLIQTPQNLLQALKEQVLISQLNPFEFFIDCRKQVEVTKG
jgi:hypothetical protein